MANSNAAGSEKRVFDVNALAIYLANGHPGFEYVSPLVEAGLRGAYTPVLMDILPIRAYWIMTHPWGLPKPACASAIQHFVQSYDMPKYASLHRETILEAFKLAKDLNHDVSDCMYLALALQEGASSVVTTDTDFEKLCSQVGIRYVNPVPKEVLKRFKDQNI